MRVGVTGHQEIPSSAHTYIDRTLRKFIAGLPTPIGISSLAGGADQIFALAILDQGGELHVVVPSQRYESVFSSSGDLIGYRTLLARATGVETLQYREPTEDAFLAAGRRVVDLADELIAIWDGEEARGVGGTADVVGYARDNGVPVTIIWPRGVKR